jgi:gluconolactonase
VPAGGGEPEIVAECGGGPNGVAIGPDGAAYVCNNGGVYRRTDGRLQRIEEFGARIQRVDLGTGAVTDLYTSCDERPFLALNDLVFDGAGGFWFTDHGRVRPGVREHGAILYASADGGHVTRVVDDVADPNGIGLSPAGDVVYWAETIGRWLKRRRIESPGVAARARRSDPWVTVAALPTTIRFDSLAVDADGRVCVGTLEPGGVAVIDPTDGSVELHVPPAGIEEDYVTNICFGGDDLRTAYLTCSLSGRLVSCRWPAAGLPLAHR